MNFSERFNARHVRMANNVVGFQTVNAVVGISGMAASLGSCTTALPECQAGRAVTERSREDGADCSGTTAETRRSE
jgi:hypothetical protein